MYHHRSCEACKRYHSVTAPHLHPYLKRKSKLNSTTARAAKTPGLIDAATSSINAAMSDARATNVRIPPSLLEAEAAPTLVKTSEDPAFDERVNAAQIRVSKLLEEARGQLVAPRIPSDELTAEDKVERSNALAWARVHEQREADIEAAKRMISRLSREVIDAADSLNVDRVTIALTPIPYDTATEAPFRVVLSGQKPLNDAGASRDQTEAFVTSESTTLSTPQRELVYEEPTPAPPQQKRAREVFEPNSTSSKLTRNRASPTKEWQTLWSFDYNTRR